jgi:hypothetical protein
MNVKTEHILNTGESIAYEYMYKKIDLKWIVRHNGKFYHIEDKDSPPIEISEERAKEILSSYPDVWVDAIRLGWWNKEEVTSIFTK